MTPREMLADLLRHPGCEVSSETREAVLTVLPRPELFVKTRLTDAYRVDAATGLRTPRTLAERIVWRFLPTDDLLAAAPDSTPTPVAPQTAAPVPKRRKRFGHQGNGLKGPQTKKMVQQRTIFERYLKSHPADERNSRISRAHQCWLAHRDDWEKARTAQGEAKGYSGYKSLAAAK